MLDDDLLWGPAAELPVSSAYPPHQPPLLRLVAATAGDPRRRGLLQRSVSVGHHHHNHGSGSGNSSDVQYIVHHHLHYHYFAVAPRNAWDLTQRGMPVLSQERADWDTNINLNLNNSAARADNDPPAVTSQDSTASTPATLPSSSAHPSSIPATLPSPSRSDRRHVYSSYRRRNLQHHSSTSSSQPPPPSSHRHARHHHHQNRQSDREREREYREYREHAYRSERGEREMREMRQLRELRQLGEFRAFRNPATALDHINSGIEHEHGNSLAGGNSRRRRGLFGWWRHHRLQRHSALGSSADDGFDFSYEELIELDSRNVTRGLNNDELDQLPTKIVAKGISDGEKNQCCGTDGNDASNSSSNVMACHICLENVCEDEVLVVLKCDHEFHQKCIHTWLKLKRTCPVCRCNVLE